VRPLVKDVAVRARRTAKVRRIKVVTTFVSPLPRDVLAESRDIIFSSGYLLIPIKIKKGRD